MTESCLQRCPWAKGSPAMVRYHDCEWGVPVDDDRRLFEFLLLEGAQAGLSWSTVLARREGYRACFADFDPARIARFGPADEARLLADSRIIRNRLKVRAAVENARRFLEVASRHGSFAAWFWRFTEGRPVVNAWEDPSRVPAATPLAETISRELRREGFRFVGPVIVYSFMQATGMVNDHLAGCFRHREIAQKYLCWEACAELQ